jgi:DNA ligase-1
MLPYIEVARALEAVRREERRDDKAEAVASLLRSMLPEMLRPTARLLSGRLWPPWESREMGIGPEILGEVIGELSGRGRSAESEGSDLGDLAFMMVQRRSQQTLTSSSTDALHVYDSLRQISDQRGLGSLSRKKSILKGLLLNATPLEAKYIARTVLGRMMVGLGPSLMADAIGKAFSVEAAQVERAYALLPDFGIVALSAYRGEIFEVKLAPPNPARFMLFGQDRGEDFPISTVEKAAYLVRYGGLRVQVHKLNDQVFIYTSQLRSVTSPLDDLAEEVMRIKGNFIMEGEFLLVHRGGISPRSDMVGRINLKGRPKDLATPSFAASDLLYLDGRELIDEGYAERRRLLSRGLKGVAGEPLSSKVFLAEEKVSCDPDEVMELLRWSLDRGFGGLIMRHPDGRYTPGSRSRGDVLISHIHGTISGPKG